MPPVLLGLLAVAAALVIGSRCLRGRVRAMRWKLPRRAACAVFVAALIYNAVAGPGVLQSALRWLYMLTGIVVAGDGIVRVVLGRCQRERRQHETDEAMLPRPLGEETGGMSRKVDLVIYLRSALRQTRDAGEQLSVFFVDLAAVGAAGGSIEKPMERIRARSRRRDFIASDSATLVLVRRAKYAVRDAQLAALAVPTADEEGTPVRIGVASYPKDGRDPAAIIRYATEAMRDLRQDDAIAQVAHPRRSVAWPLRPRARPTSLAGPAAPGGPPPGEGRGRPPRAG